MNPYIAEVSSTMISIVMWAIIARMLLSWFPIDQSSPLVQLLHRVTEPLINPIRKLMPATGMLDFSPMLAIIGLIVLQTLVSSVSEPL